MSLAGLLNAVLTVIFGFGGYVVGALGFTVALTDEHIQSRLEARQARSLQFGELGPERALLRPSSSVIDPADKVLRTAGSQKGRNFNHLLRAVNGRADATATQNCGIGNNCLPDYASAQVRSRPGACEFSDTRR
jgi:hypothetical protein